MSFYSDIYAANGSPVLALSQFFYGHTPETASLFDSRSNFIASQESAGIKMGVGDSDLFGYETLGKTLGETAEGKAKLAGGTDLQFIQKMYVEIFGRDASSAQVAHFEAQIDYFKGLYTANGLSSDTIEFGSRGAIVGQMMGLAVADGTTDYAKGVASVYSAAAMTGTIEFGKPLGDYASSPTEPEVIIKEVIVTKEVTVIKEVPVIVEVPVVTPDVIVSATDASLLASSTNGHGNIQAGSGITNAGFQTTTNVTKGIELGLQVVKRGGPDIYGFASRDGDGIIHIEALAGADASNAARAAIGVTFSANTGIHDVKTGPYTTKFYVDTDSSAGIDFAVFDIYKDGKVTSANVAQDVYNLGFLATPQPNPAAGSSYAYKIETTDAGGAVLASQMIIVDLVGSPTPLDFG